MAYADILRSTTFTLGDVADLIENMWTNKYPLEWTAWTPATWGGAGSMTYTSVTLGWARYIACGKLFIFSLKATGTLGGVATTSFYCTMPSGLNINTAGTISQASGYAAFEGASLFTGRSFSATTGDTSDRIYFCKSAFDAFTLEAVAVRAEGVFILA